MKYPINEKAMMKYLSNNYGKIITASGLAHFIGVERIYGGTMAKLVRDGYLDKMPLNGYYRIK